jgi:tRNA (guanosine-2'-O-)-methyltransferase
VPERLNGHDWKSCDGETRPGVRIPLSPLVHHERKGICPGALSATKSRARDIRRARRQRSHSCWDHLVVAPLWVAYGANLGTLLRTCDAVGACIAVPATPLPRLEPARGRTVVLLGHERQGIPDDIVAGADECVEIPMVGRGASLNVAVAGSLVLYRLAGLA